MNSSMNGEHTDGNLLDLLPPLTRARDYHLYDVKGRRYLDLYQDGGRALLGHRAGNLSLVLKNVLSRGLLPALPSIYDARLQKSLKMIFPDFAVFRVYRFPGKAGIPVDPLFDQAGRQPLKGEGDVPSSLEPALWRPFSGLDYSRYSVLCPVYPFPGIQDLQIACYRTASADIPVSDSVSPVLLAGLARAFSDLAGQTDRYVLPHAPRFESSLWSRQGMYLLPAYREALHADIFRIFLREGFLLSPEYGVPSIIPRECSEGELRKFRDTVEKALVETGGADGN